LCYRPRHPLNPKPLTLNLKLQGYFCVIVRGILLKVLDFALFADITARTAHTMSDFKKVNKDRSKTK